MNTQGNYLPHLFAVDQTLHWANPPGGIAGRDMHGTDPTPYTGPVPLITHVHGAHVTPESDGYPEAWYLPNANNIPAGYATQGTYFDQFDRTNTTPGSAVFQYANDQAACTLWYHDHALGMTRINVYAGPAGFYLLRGGVRDLVTGILPAPAPARGDPPSKKYYEIPIAIQDRSFNTDGSLFFPSDRAFFEYLTPNQLRIPFIPDVACNGLSDISPIHNPEFFGNTMLVNGNTWPILQVEQRRYRFRILDGCNARTLILKMDNGMPFYQIGAEQGFLPAPIQLDTLRISLAERADVILDFTNIPVGTKVTMLNIGPDFPFGGGQPGIDFPPSDQDTTGQVMQFEVAARVGTDRTTPPMNLKLPTLTPLGAAINTRKVSLNELDSSTVFIDVNPVDGSININCASPIPFGPIRALLGILDSNGNSVPLMWNDPITENPALNSTEIWEIYNFTVDGHPIHLHQVAFQVIDRTPMGFPVGGALSTPPEPWESGYKDTVVALPGQITRLKAKFNIAGRYVWHCHIIDHEDNEMMRPFFVGPMPPPMPMAMKMSKK